MTSDWNDQLPVLNDAQVQVWIIGSRDQVVHMMNEFYVKRIATIFLRKHFVNASTSPPLSPHRSRTGNIAIV